MKDLSVFLTPIPADLFADIPVSKSQLGKQIDYHTEGHFPEGEDVKIAIIGVEEDRYSENNKGCAQAPNFVRKQLAQHFGFDQNISIADLGNIAAGEKVEDTYVALKTICQELIKDQIIPVIIGGSQDLTFANYIAYEKLEQTVNLVTVDPLLSFSSFNKPIDSNTFLNNIILHQPNYLFNYSNIGNQRPYVDKELYELMDKMFFDTYRLGEVAEDIKSVEPVVRNADLLSFDISAIKRSDAPGSKQSGPNGFTAQQACQLCRYAGMSDKLSSVGFYEFNPETDIHNNTASLLAEMIWYLIDGVINRKRDYPIGDYREYQKFIVNLSDKNHQITFFKSHLSNRWWMEVPYPAGKKNRYQRHHLVPCTYADYQQATNEEVPDRWWKAYQKLT
ncbi:formimidoylglutamase [Halocola ammonii]